MRMIGARVRPAIVIALLTACDAPVDSSLVDASSAIRDASGSVADATIADAATGSDAGPVSCTGEPHRVGGPDGTGGCWPGPDNTGVPEGTTLTDYTGPCTITTDDTVIDAQEIACDLVIRAARVSITRSRIMGSIHGANDPAHSFTLTDSEVVVSRAGADGATGIGEANFTVLRVEVRGGNRSILCGRACTVQDSWVHGQDIVEDVRVHASGIRQSQGATLLHNSIACDVADTPSGGGCSASLTGYGDFEPVSDNRLERNLFVATTGGACAYGGSSGDDGTKPYGDQAANIRFVGNVFQRGAGGTCGVYFPITDFDSSRPGNMWVNNRWDDGEEVPPAN